MHFNLIKPLFFRIRCAREKKLALQVRTRERGQLSVLNGEALGLTTTIRTIEQALR